MALQHAPLSFLPERFAARSGRLAPSVAVCLGRLHSPAKNACATGGCQSFCLSVPAFMRLHDYTLRLRRPAVQLHCASRRSPDNAAIIVGAGCAVLQVRHRGKPVLVMQVSGFSGEGVGRLVATGLLQEDAEDYNRSSLIHRPLGWSRVWMRGAPDNRRSSQIQGFLRWMRDMRAPGPVGSATGGSHSRKG